jgi:endonuclease YncB( thermonuclease family)
MRPIMILLVCALTPIASAQAQIKQEPKQKPKLDTYAIDGDSLQIGKDEVRLWGIDAPEYNQTCEPNTVQAGRIAKAFLQHLVDNKPVQCKHKGRDHYGRPLVICLNHEGSDLGRKMVEAGWAWSTPKYSVDYVDYESAARHQKLGVHAMICELPWNWRRQNGRGSQPVPPLKK